LDDEFHTYSRSGRSNLQANSAAETHP
jgi:hypothetical protein